MRTAAFLWTFSYNSIFNMIEKFMKENISPEKCISIFTEGVCAVSEEHTGQGLKY